VHSAAAVEAAGDVRDRGQERIHEPAARSVVPALGRYDQLPLTLR
jgi:hypothetical protein